MKFPVLLKTFLLSLFFVTFTIKLATASVTLHAGWNLIHPGAGVSPASLGGAVFTYSDGQWSSMPTTFTKMQGAWVYREQGGNFAPSSDLQYPVESISEAGWYLLGSGRVDTLLSEIKSTIESELTNLWVRKIYTFSAGQWVPYDLTTVTDDAVVAAGQGVWVGVVSTLVDDIGAPPIFSGVVSIDTTAQAARPLATRVLSDANTTGICDATDRIEVQLYDVADVDYENALLSEPITTQDCNYEVQATDFIDPSMANSMSAYLVRAVVSDLVVQQDGSAEVRVIEVTSLKPETAEGEETVVNVDPVSTAISQQMISFVQNLFGESFEITDTVNTAIKTFTTSLSVEVRSQVESGELQLDLDNYVVSTVEYSVGEIQQRGLSAGAGEIEVMEAFASDLDQKLDESLGHFDADNYLDEITDANLSSVEVQQQAEVLAAQRREEISLTNIQNRESKEQRVSALMSGNANFSAQVAVFQNTVSMNKEAELDEKLSAVIGASSINADEDLARVKYRLISSIARMGMLISDGSGNLIASLSVNPDSIRVLPGVQYQERAITTDVHGNEETVLIGDDFALRLIDVRKDLNNPNPEWAHQLIERLRTPIIPVNAIYAMMRNREQTITLSQLSEYIISNSGKEQEFSAVGVDVTGFFEHLYGIEMSADPVTMAERIVLADLYYRLQANLKDTLFEALDILMRRSERAGVGADRAIEKFKELIAVSGNEDGVQFIQRLAAAPSGSDTDLFADLDPRWVLREVVTRDAIDALAPALPLFEGRDEMQDVLQLVESSSGSHQIDASTRLVPKTALTLMIQNVHRFGEEADQIGRISIDQIHEMEWVLGEVTDNTEVWWPFDDSYSEAMNSASIMSSAGEQDEDLQRQLQDEMDPQDFILGLVRLITGDQRIEVEQQLRQLFRQVEIIASKLEARLDEYFGRRAAIAHFDSFNSSEGDSYGETGELSSAVQITVFDAISSQSITSDHGLSGVRLVPLGLRFNDFEELEGEEWYLQWSSEQAAWEGEIVLRRPGIAISGTKLKATDMFQMYLQFGENWERGEMFPLFAMGGTGNAQQLSVPFGVMEFDDGSSTTAGSGAVQEEFYHLKSEIPSQDLHFPYLQHVDGGNVGESILQFVTPDDGDAESNRLQLLASYQRRGVIHGTTMRLFVLARNWQENDTLWMQNEGRVESYLETVASGQGRGRVAPVEAGVSFFDSNWQQRCGDDFCSESDNDSFDTEMYLNGKVTNGAMLLLDIDTPADDAQLRDQRLLITVDNVWQNQDRIEVSLNAVLAEGIDDPSSIFESGHFGGVDVSDQERFGQGMSVHFVSGISNERIAEGASIQFNIHDPYVLQGGTKQVLLAVREWKQNAAGEELQRVGLYSGNASAISGSEMTLSQILDGSASQLRSIQSDFMDRISTTINEAWITELDHSAEYEFVAYAVEDLEELYRNMNLGLQLSGGNVDYSQYGSALDQFMFGVVSYSALAEVNYYLMGDQVQQQGADWLAGDAGGADNNQTFVDRLVDQQGRLLNEEAKFYFFEEYAGSAYLKYLKLWRDGRYELTRQRKAVIDPADLSLFLQALASNDDDYSVETGEWGITENELWLQVDGQPHHTSLWLTGVGDDLEGYLSFQVEQPGTGQLQLVQTDDVNNVPQYFSDRIYHWWSASNGSSNAGESSAEEFSLQFLFNDAQSLVAYNDLVEQEEESSLNRRLPRLVPYSSEVRPMSRRLVRRSAATNLHKIKEVEEQGETVKESEPAVESSIPFQVMYSVADPAGDMVYVAVDRWASDEFIRQTSCTIYAVTVVDNSYSCVKDGVEIQTIDENYGRQLSGDQKPIQFDGRGNMYFAARDLNTGGNLKVYKRLKRTGRVRSVTREEQYIEFFLVLDSGEVVYRGELDLGIPGVPRERGLYLYQGGATYKVSSADDMPFFNQDDHNAVFWQQQGQLKFAAPHSDGGFNYTTLNSSQEIEGHLVRVVKGDDGRLYGVYETGRDVDDSQDSDDWRNILDFYQILPADGRKKAEIILPQGEGWWDMVQGTGFQIANGNLYYIDRVTALRRGQHDVIRVVDLESGNRSTLLGGEDDLYDIYAWQLTGRVLSFSGVKRNHFGIDYEVIYDELGNELTGMTLAQRQAEANIYLQELRDVHGYDDESLIEDGYYSTQTVVVSGEVNTQEVSLATVQAELESALTISPVASALDAALAVRDIEVMTARETVDASTQPYLQRFVAAPDNLTSMTLDFSKHMNRESVLNSVSLLSSNDDEGVNGAIESMPLWLGRTLHLIPDLSIFDEVGSDFEGQYAGLGDNITTVLSRDTTYTLTIDSGAEDLSGNSIFYTQEELEPAFGEDAAEYQQLLTYYQQSESGYQFALETIPERGTYLADVNMSDSDVASGKAVNFVNMNSEFLLSDEITENTRIEFSLKRSEWSAFNLRLFNIDRFSQEHAADSSTGNLNRNLDYREIFNVGVSGCFEIWAPESSGEGYRNCDNQGVTHDREWARYRIDLIDRALKVYLKQEGEATFTEITNLNIPQIDTQAMDNLMLTLDTPSGHNFALDDLTLTSMDGEEPGEIIVSESFDELIPDTIQKGWRTPISLTTRSDETTIQTEDLFSGDANLSFVTATGEGVGLSDDGSQLTFTDSSFDGSEFFTYTVHNVQEGIDEQGTVYVVPAYGTVSATVSGSDVDSRVASGSALRFLGQERNYELLDLADGNMRIEFSINRKNWNEVQLQLIDTAKYLNTGGGSNHQSHEYEIKLSNWPSMNYRRSEWDYPHGGTCCDSNDEHRSYEQWFSYRIDVVDRKIRVYASPTGDFSSDAERFYYNFSTWEDGTERSYTEINDYTPRDGDKKLLLRMPGNVLLDNLTITEISGEDDSGVPALGNVLLEENFDDQTVNAAFDKPWGTLIAVNDRLSVEEEGGVVSLNMSELVLNDLVEDRDSLEIVSVTEDSSAPLQGTLSVPASLSESTSISYTDAGGHVGEEHFHYTVRDRLSGEESTGTVYLIPGSGAYISTLQQSSDGVSDGHGLRLATRGNFELLSGIEHDNFRAEISVYREGWETPMLSLLNRSRMVNSGGDSWSSREFELQLSDSPSFNYRSSDTSWDDMQWKSVWDTEDGATSWNHPSELNQRVWARWRVDVQGQKVSIAYSDDGVDFTEVELISVTDFERQNGVLDLILNTGGGEQAMVLDNVRVIELDSDGLETGSEIVSLDFETDSDLQNFTAYWGELADTEAEPQLPTFNVTDVAGWVRLYGRVREGDNGSWIESDTGETGTNLLTRDSTGALALAVDADKPVYVSEVALDSERENLYVALSGKGEWWRNDWWGCPTCDDRRNEARMIGEQRCALFKVGLSTGEAQCVIENVLPIPMLGKQDRVNGVSSLQFDGEGNLYFAAAPYGIEVTNQEYEWASYEMDPIDASRPIYLYRIPGDLTAPVNEGEARYFDQAIESLGDNNWIPVHSFSYRVLSEGVVVLHQRSSKDYQGSDDQFWEDWEEDSRIHLISDNGLSSITEISDVRAIFSDEASSLVVVPHDENIPPMLMNVEHGEDEDRYRLVALGSERNSANYKYSVGAIMDGDDLYHVSDSEGLHWLLNPEGKADVKPLDISDWSVTNLFRRDLLLMSDGKVYHADNRVSLDDGSGEYGDIDHYGDMHKVSRYLLDRGTSQELIADDNLRIDRLFKRQGEAVVVGRAEQPSEGLSDDSTWEPYVATLQGDTPSVWELNITGSRDAMKVTDLLLNQGASSMSSPQNQVIHSPLSLDAIALDLADGVEQGSIMADLTHSVTGNTIDMVPLVTGSRITWALESDGDLTNLSSSGLVTGNGYSLALTGEHTENLEFDAPPERGWMVDGSDLIYWAGDAQNEWIVELTPDSGIGENFRMEFNALKGSDFMEVTYWDQQAHYAMYGRLVEWQLGNNWSDWRGNDQSSIAMRYSDESCNNCGSWGATTDTLLTDRLRRYRLQILNNEVSTWISEDGGVSWAGDTSGELDALQSSSLSLNNGASIARSGEGDYRLLLGVTDRTRISDLSVMQLDSSGSVIETMELVGDSPVMELFATEWTEDQWLDERW